MELLQLKYFCDAAESGKLSATARRFFVPTSNISQSVKRLEKELGCELFEHRANKVVLNENGKAFYEKTAAALLLLEDARTALSGADEKIGGELQLLVFCNRRHVTDAIERFKAAYPETDFLLRHDSEEGFSPDIVVTDRVPQGYQEAALLIEEEILLAMDKKHPLARKKNLSLNDLRDARFISMPKGRSLYRLTETICRDAGFTPQITIQTDDPYYVRKYVSLGLGVAFVPAFSWQGLFPENVVLRRIGDRKRKTYICFKKGKKPTKAVSAFLSFLTKPDVPHT